MSASEDLINFDIIETQKENIQSLPQGRSAKALASAFAPSIFSPVATPGSTRNLNDAIRGEYETELLSIDDSDDPLDIYDRYVKWTLNAYPSAQATPESRLRTLLERATKAFQNVASYKNDPRYLKLWLSYICFFSDAPRETFAYLARHNIGEGLALFYEEFAAWLEGANRWAQAEEVYKLGIEREARPSERLLRKFGEFQTRFEARPRDQDGPSSPALPTVRPALAAKLDPFATEQRPSDPQSQRLPAASTAARGGKQKMAIFSDADGSAASAITAGSKGWDNIGSIQDRKKENMVEARPWAGETLKAGKKVRAEKMPVFKDQSKSAAYSSEMNASVSNSAYASQQQSVNARTGRIERVFVRLDAVYPNSNDLSEEYSFDELRARRRGWLDKKWEPQRKENKTPKVEAEITPDNTQNDSTGEQSQQDFTVDVSSVDQTLSDVTGPRQPSREGKSSKPRKKKLVEESLPTQTIKLNLDSPAGRKIKRKNSAEPTMTLHTRAATDDILDIFNQPLRNIGQIDADADSGPDSDDDDDEDEDDYTSGGESTATGRISGATSEFGDDTGVQSEPAPDSTEVKSVSDWSDFTKSKHVPKVPGVNDDEDDETHQTDASGQVEVTQDDLTTEDGAQLQTPVSPKFTEEVHTRFIPIPPEDYEAPTHPYRDAAQIEQNRLPFMTPIVEKTESSITMPSARNAQRDYFNSKTPSRHRAEDPALPEIENLLISSPLQEIVKEAAPVSRETKPIATAKPVAKKQAGPIIKDLQCNPVDESIRATILESIDPPLFSFAGFHDHSDTAFGRGSEIRKFVKALCKPSSNSEKTTSITTQPIIRFPSITNYEYIIKRELGKGAYAPVYLTEQIPISSDDTSDSDESKEVASTLLALKSEHPPSPWEFYIMETLHSRLAASHTISRATESLAKPHSLHLFSDECYLLESYHPHGTLLDLINLSKTPDAPPLDECLSMFFTVELLRTIESLHSVSILHGDIKADNCLLRLPSISDSDWANRYAANGDGMWSAKGLVLIDFGRGIDMSQFSKDVGFLADWKTDTMDCREMRTLRPWTGQIDYFAVAGLVHLLLLGRWIDECEDKSSTLSSRGVGMEEEGKDDDNNGEGKVDERQDMTIGINLTKTKRFKVKEPLKRYWQVELWSSLFDVLLNPTLYVSPQGGGRGNVVMIPEKLAEVRKKFEAYLEENSEKKGLKNGLRRWEERLGRRR